MQKSPLASLIDNIFYCLGTIILCCIFIGKYTRSISLQFCLGIILGIFSYIIVYKLFKNKSNNKTLSLKKTKHLNDCKQTLSSANPEKVSILLSKIFESADYQIECIKSNTIYLKREGKTYFAINNFLSKEMTASDIFSCPQTNADFVILFSNQFDQSAINYSRNKPNLILIDMQQTYNLFDSHKIFPKTSPSVKKSIKSLKNNIFMQINAKKFIKVSLFLLGFSFFTIYKDLYRITATLCFIFSLICHFKQSSPPETPSTDQTFITSLAGNKK